MQKRFHSGRGGGRQGFTLIELAIVVGIIMVLVAIAIPNFMGQRKRARISSAMATMKMVRDAMEMYHNDYDTYPQGVGGFAQLAAALSPKYFTGDTQSLNKNLHQFVSYNATDTTWQMVVLVENEATITGTDDNSVCAGSGYCPTNN